MVGFLLVILAGLSWAVDTLVRYPLLGAGVSAERIVFTEHLFLTLIFIPIFFKHSLPLWQAKVSSVFYFMFVGILGSAVASLCFTKAFTMINPSLVILLQKFQPIIAILLASVLLKEKIQRVFVIWAGVALLGGILISSPDILPGLSNFDLKLGFLSEKAMMGYLLTMVAVVSWGASTVFGKKLSSSGYDELQIMGGRFVFGFLFLCFYVYANRGIVTFDWSMVVWGKILLMVLLSGLLGMYLYYKGLKMISARACAIAETFFPLSAVAINWIFLHKPLMSVQIVGAVLLTVSSTVIQLKKY